MPNFTCPNCNTEITETTKFCPECGNKIELTLAQEIQTEVKKTKNKKKTILTIIIILAVLILLAFGGHIFTTKYYLPKQNYEEGLSQMEKHNYTLAIEAFEKSNGYSDSKEKIAEIKTIQANNEILYALSSAYKKCHSSHTIMATDNLSISVDSKNKYDTDSLNDIKTIIYTLDLPDSLYDSMSQTTALMGRQKETYGNYEVSWSYHPDNGLDVIFRIVE